MKTFYKKVIGLKERREVKKQIENIGRGGIQRGLVHRSMCENIWEDKEEINC